MSKGKDLNATDGDKDLVKYADIGATYYFNKNMSTYVDYKINLLDEDDSFYTRNNISTDDVVALGLVLPVLIPQPAGNSGLSLCSNNSVLSRSKHYICCVKTSL